MTSATLSFGGRLRAAAAITALATCAAVGAIGTAHAASAPAVTVSYADLNLSTEEGSVALYARIVAAAHEVCAVDVFRDLRAVAASRTCTQQAIARAVRDVNSPKLASVYAARSQHG